MVFTLGNYILLHINSPFVQLEGAVIFGTAFAAKDVTFCYGPANDKPAISARNSCVEQPTAGECLLLPPCPQPPLISVTGRTYDGRYLPYVRRAPLARFPGLGLKGVDDAETCAEWCDAFSQAT